MNTKREPYDHNIGHGCIVIIIAIFASIMFLASCTGTSYMAKKYDKMEAGQPSDTTYQTGGIYIVSNFQYEGVALTPESASIKKDTFYPPRHKKCLNQHTILIFSKETPYYTVYRCGRCNSVIYVKKPLKK